MREGAARAEGNGGGSGRGGREGGQDVGAMLVSEGQLPPSWFDGPAPARPPSPSFPFPACLPVAIQTLTSLPFVLLQPCFCESSGATMWSRLNQGHLGFRRHRRVLEIHPYVEGQGPALHEEKENVDHDRKDH